AGRGEPFHAPCVHHREQVGGGLRQAVAGGVHRAAGAAVAQEVDPDHPPAGDQSLGHSVPARRGAGEPVKQEDRLSPAFVHHVEPDAVHLDEAHAGASPPPPASTGATASDTACQIRRCSAALAARSLLTSITWTPGRRRLSSTSARKWLQLRAVAKAAPKASAAGRKSRPVGVPNSASKCSGRPAWGRNEKMPPPSLWTSTTVAESPCVLAARSPVRSWRNERSPMTSTRGPSQPAAAPKALETPPSMPLAPRLAKKRTSRMGAESQCVLAARSPMR